MGTPSEKYSLNWQDVLKGALLASITILAATIGQLCESYVDSLVNGTVFVLDKISIALSVKAAIGAFFAYLTKNYFTQPPQPIVSAKNDTLPASPK